jgi:hypothetical protein
MGVNFTNILQAPFLCLSVLDSFLLITVWVCNFWLNEIGTKAAGEMLMKLTIGVDFINILLAAFTCTDHKSAKIQ